MSCAPSINTPSGYAACDAGFWWRLADKFDKSGSLDSEALQKALVRFGSNQFCDQGHRYDTPANIALGVSRDHASAQRFMEAILSAGTPYGAEVAGADLLSGAMGLGRLRVFNLALKYPYRENLNFSYNGGPILYAIKYGKHNSDRYLKKLIKAGFDIQSARISRTPSSSTEYMGTPLHMAVEAKNLAAVKTLIAAGAIQKPATLGYAGSTYQVTPQEMAVRGNAPALAKALSGGSVKLESPKPEAVPDSGQKQKQKQKQKPQAVPDRRQRQIPAESGAGCTKASLDSEARNLISSFGNPPQGAGNQVRWQQKSFRKLRVLYVEQQQRCPSINLSAAISYADGLIATSDEQARILGLN